MVYPNRKAVNGGTNVRRKSLTAAFLFATLLPVLLNITLNVPAVNAQSPSLEDVLAELQLIEIKLNGIESNMTSLSSALEELNTKLVNVQASVDALGAVSATNFDIATLDSALNKLDNATRNLQSSIAYLTASVADESDVESLRSALDALRLTVDKVKTELASLSENSVTREDFRTTETSLNESIKHLETLISVILFLVSVIVGVQLVVFYYLLRRTKPTK